MVLSNVAPLRLSVDKGGSFMRRQQAETSTSPSLPKSTIS